MKRKIVHYISASLFVIGILTIFYTASMSDAMTISGMETLWRGVAGLATMAIGMCGEVLIS